MRNFFLPPEKWKEPYILAGQEATHLVKVLRLQSGETIRLLDGAGRSGEFIIKHTAKSMVELEPLVITEHPLPERRCFLAAAYTKAARRSWIFEKSVEFEAGGIWFWQAEHSQAKTPEMSKENWKEQLIAGAKQCFNPWLPELRTFTGGASEIAALRKNFQQAFLLWEDADNSSILRYPDLCPSGDTLFVMGPEGGLHPDEVEIYKKNDFRPVSLGNRILRWETAAVLCLGLGWWSNQVEQNQE